VAEPFLSEVRIMSFEFAPKGWALCNGQLLPINQNQALFSLLGTDVRWRRSRQLRAAGLARTHADPCWERPYAR
jgi:Phage Tail Collar Domain